MLYTTFFEIFDEFTLLNFRFPVGYIEHIFLDSLMIFLKGFFFNILLMFVIKSVPGEFPPLNRMLRGVLKKI